MTDNYKTLKNKAIYLLSLREYSIFKLKEKLLQSYEWATEDVVDQLIEELKQANYISDERYAELYIRSRQQKYGKQRIQFELSRKGIASDEIQEQLEVLDDDQQLEQAKSVWLRKFKGNRPQDRNEYAKHVRFLHSRGFSPKIISKLLKNLDEFETFDD